MATAKDDAEHVKKFEALNEAEQKNFLMVARRSLSPKVIFDENEAKVKALSTDRAARYTSLLAKAKTHKEVVSFKGRGSNLQNIGAFFSIYLFGFFASRMGRRKAFLISFLCGWAALLLTF